jgi:hypothetical protein
MDGGLILRVFASGEIYRRKGEIGGRPRGPHHRAARPGVKQNIKQLVWNKHGASKIIDTFAMYQDPPCQVRVMSVLCLTAHFVSWWIIAKFITAHFVPWKIVTKFVTTHLVLPVSSGRKISLRFTDFPGTQVCHGPFHPTKNRRQVRHSSFRPTC